MDKTAIIVAFVYGVFNLAGTWIAAKKSSTAVKKANVVNTKVDDVKRSVGPVNGESIHEVLHKVREFQIYQQDRNHDILGLLSTALMSQSIIAHHLGIELPKFEKPQPYPHPDGDTNEKGN